MQMKKPQFWKFFAAAWALLFVAACATTTPQTADFDAQQKELRMRGEALALKEAELDERLAAVMEAESKAQESPSGEVQSSLFPPGSQPGSCYARVFVPNSYRVVTETMLKREAGERIETTPPQFETASEKVMIEAPSRKLVLRPAEYGMEEESVLVSPAKRTLVEVPARYETVSEKVMVRAAHNEWKKGSGPIQKIDHATGEIMCLVEEPAIYRTVTKKVLKSPATTQWVEEPAVFKTVKKKVMIQEPTTEVVEIPAKFKTIKVTRMVTPAQERRVEIPAEYQTVTKKVLDNEAHMEWREILCQTNMTPDRISKIQMALNEKGFDSGPVDGAVGPRTMKAVNSFQRANNLVVSKYLTVNTVKALGVSPK
jgi:putative peptidoglycan binding protein